MHRDDAIQILVAEDIKSRSARLDAMQEYHWGFSNWTLEEAIKDIEKNNDDPNLALIVSKGLFENIRMGDFSNIMDPIYDEILIADITPAYKYHRNSYLSMRLQKLGLDMNDIEGEPEPAVSCPCCGADVFGAREGWDICPVCWWEDDFTDNKDASLYFSGPNEGLQLTAARINFLMFGIYNPARTDLRDSLIPLTHFKQSRIFEIDKDKSIIIEKGTDWWAPLALPHLKPAEALPKVSLAGALMRDWPRLEDE